VNMIDDCGFVEAIVGFTVLLLDNMNGLATNIDRERLFDKIVVRRPNAAWDIQ